MKRESGLSDAQDASVLGRRMIDENGAVIGRIKDVLYGEPADDAPWAVVGIGVLGSERFAPLRDAYLADDGKVVVPYDKTLVKGAPRAGDHVLVPAVRAALAAYYGA
jgi:hypothetical protein